MTISDAHITKGEKTSKVQNLNLLRIYYHLLWMSSFNANLISTYWPSKKTKSITPTDQKLTDYSALPVSARKFRSVIIARFLATDGNSFTFFGCRNFSDGIGSDTGKTKLCRK